MMIPRGDEPPARVTPASPVAAGDVALFIDWENLKIGLRRAYNVVPNISSLTEAAREYGRLVQARAYGDWTDDALRDDAPGLYRAGIEPIYVPGRSAGAGATLKNSADVRLAVDAVALCGQLPQIGTFVLVTGDQDLIHALNFLRMQGRRVVVIAVVGSLSALLSSAADAVLLYERDIEPLESLPTGPRAAPPRPGGAHQAAAAGTAAATATPPPAAVPPMETVHAWIVALLEELGGETPYPFNRIATEIRNRFPEFRARAWYGVPFKRVMLEAERAGLIQLSTAEGTDYAALRRDEAPARPPPAAAPEETAAPKRPARRRAPRRAAGDAP